MMITELLLLARFSILLCLEMDTRQRLLRCCRCFSVKDCNHKHNTLQLYFMNIYGHLVILYPVQFTLATGIQNITDIIDTRWMVGGLRIHEYLCYVIVFFEHFLLTEEIRNETATVILARRTAWCGNRKIRTRPFG